MDTEEIARTALKYSLQNAVQFEGVAQLKAVIGKVIAEYSSKGVHPKKIIPLVQDAVKEVNQWSVKKQREKLEEMAPELLEKKKKVRDFSLPDLPHAVQGKVVTRFPPEPNGYLHIGHAKAVIVDYEYAVKYEGRFILRFDDTNPEKDEAEFYNAQKEDLKWLGISWDEEYHTSDNLKHHYELARQLIGQGDAYVCRCSPDLMKKGRYEIQPCVCRSMDIDGQVEHWDQMLAGSFDAVLRLKADMKSANTAMRDPTLFRIIDSPHPLQRDRFHVWPTYDFAGAVEDSESGVTHPFRTKEYELRDEVYFFLLEKLDMRKPHLMEFARLNIEGMPVSKRKIRPLIDEGVVYGYDDIRLPTLQGLRRRGIIPEGIKQFVLTQGISKVESTVPFSLVESENRKIIDPISKRFFFVPDPVHLKVENAPEKTVSIPFHPTENLGERKTSAKNQFYVPRDDMKEIVEGEVFRLKDLFNVEMIKKGSDLIGRYAGEDLIYKSRKIQWTTDSYVQVRVNVADLLFKDDKVNKESLTCVTGYAEPEVASLQTGDIVQFERFGFIRIEKKNKEIIGYFAHK
jgi:glutamyl-tRNA synthetase